MKRTWINDGSVEVGLDEAGRGSLWGRLYVGAVIMSPEDEAYFDNGVALRQITDSKKLTPRRRAILADFIRENAIEATVAWAEPPEIDEGETLTHQPRAELVEGVVTREHLDGEPAGGVARTKKLHIIKS